jgi:hypothetical protein
MNSNWTRWIVVVVLAIVGGGAVAALARPAMDRPYSDRSLDGTYIGAFIEIRQDPAGVGPFEFCDMSGTFTFDGAGTGTSSLVRKCSLSGTVIDNDTLTYAVASDGAVTLNFSSGASGDARLAQDGAIGFVTSINDTDARILVRNGSFAKR